LPIGHHWAQQSEQTAHTVVAALTRARGKSSLDCTSCTHHISTVSGLTAEKILKNPNESLASGYFKK
jgi:hypothetical protein